jgi:hypothetical protein
MMKGNVHKMMKVNGLNEEFKKYQQRSGQALTSASVRGTKAARRNAPATASTNKGGRLTMKTAKIMRLLVALTGFAALAAPCCYGQADAFPDQFDSPNPEPFPQPRTKEGDAAKTGKVRFDGQVTLPYSVRCAGKRLPPGNYSLSISSDGKTGRATLNQKSQTIEIAGVVHMPADSRTRNALFVECIGKSHRLSAIHVKEMEIVFGSDSQVEPTSDGKPRRTEKLLLTSTSPQK